MRKLLVKTVSSSRRRKSSADNRADEIPRKSYEQGQFTFNNKARKDYSVNFTRKTPSTDFSFRSFVVYGVRR